MKIGDLVSVIDDDLQGTITSVHGERVTIKDEHGFTHQYPKEKLVPQNAKIYENLQPILKKEIRKPISKKQNKSHLILDLHLENLVKNPADYNSFERLFLQKEKLMETFEFCRRNNLKKLEIVHGIGDGVLQKMVHDYLIGQTEIDFEDHDFFYHQTGSVMVNFK